MEDNIDWSIYYLGSEAEDVTKSNVLANKTVVEGITDKMIFITLNACDEWHAYMTLNQVDRKDMYKQIIGNVMKKINEIYKTKMAMEFYFEISPSGRLHVHGMIQGVPATYYPFEGMLTRISELFHKQIGKPRLRHSICADVQWAHSNDAVSRYCIKAQPEKKYYFIPRL